MRQFTSGLAHFRLASFGKNSFNIKYLESCDRYHDGVSGSQIWNRPWAIDWHHDLWPWMTLNCPSSSSSKSQVKYFKNVDRYDIAVSWRRIGSCPWATSYSYSMTFDHGWPWTVIDPGHWTSASDISNTTRDTMLNNKHNGGQIGNHEWAFDWHHDLWHWMTLNSPSSKSSKLHVKYLKNDDRYRQH